MSVVNNRKIKKKIIKNKQAKYLPVFGKKNLIKNNKVFAYTKETKKLLDEKKAQKKAKRSKLLRGLAFSLNIAILAVILIVQIFKDPSEVLTPTINWNFMAIIIGLVLLITILDATKLFILLFVSTKKARPFLSYKTSAIGKYYDNITPLATGGQPFQIFYMNKRGVRGDIATGIPLMKYITWQIAYVMICTFALIYKSVKFGTNTDPLMITVTTAAWIATAINLLIFTSIILLSVSKRFGPKLVILTLKLLAKMKIIKNYRKSFRKVMRFVVNYQKTFKTLIKNPLVLLAQLILSFGDIIITNLIPYFIVRTFVPVSAFEALNITVFSTFIQALICNLSLGFIPTPGASGVAEAVFMIVFAGAFSGNGLFWPVLTWRIATYYFPLIQGLLILVYDFVIGNKRLERMKREGAEIYQTEDKETFRKSLQNNLQTIEVVQAQEGDKIPVNFLTGINLEDNTNNEEAIIANSNIVSDEDMEAAVRPAEMIIDEIDDKQIKRHQKRIDKKNMRKQRRKRNK